MGKSKDINYWYQRVPKGDGTFWGGEQDCLPRWNVMKKLHGDLTGKTVIDVGAAEGFFRWNAQIGVQRFFLLKKKKL